MFDACRRSELHARLEEYPPRGYYLPPLVCGRQALEHFFLFLWWREPGTLAARVVRFYAWMVIVELCFLATVLVAFRVAGGRFREGKTKYFDVRDGQALVWSIGYASWILHNADNSLLKPCLAGSQARICVLEPPYIDPP